MTVYDNISFGLKNIREPMPKIFFEARTAARLAEILAKPEDVVKILADCRDKKGKLDEKRAMLKLIDNFTLSQYSAKQLLSYHLETNPDLSAAIAALQAKVESGKKAAAAAGGTLDPDFQLVKDDQVVMETRKLTREEIDLTVRRVARIVKIGMFMERYPAELSGGQQQRVAIARTLAPEPKVLFMDEPLSNLDAKLRLEMRYELQRLHVETGSTFVYVTHDQMEAMTLATQICLIENGVLQQYDAPLTVYNRPHNLFVADFVGNPFINFVDAKGAKAVEDDFSAPEEPVITDQDFVLGIRPEAIGIAGSGSLDGEIYGAMPTGMESTIKVRVDDFLLTGVVFGSTLFTIGSQVHVDVTGDNVLLFDRKSGVCIAVVSLKV